MVYTTPGITWSQVLDGAYLAVAKGRFCKAIAQQGFLTPFQRASRRVAGDVAKCLRDKGNYRV